VDINAATGAELLEFTLAIVPLLMMKFVLLDAA